MTDNINPFAPYDNHPTGDLTGKYKKDWVESALDVEVDPRSKLNLAHTRRYLGAGISAQRIIALAVCFALGAAVILARVGYLEIIKGNYYFGLAEQNRIRTVSIPAERGIFFDRFNRPLVQNIPSFNLSVIPQDLPHVAADRLQVIERVATLSGLSVDDLQNSIKKYSNYSYESLVLKENIDYETALKLYLENSNLPGIAITSGSKRKYLNSTSSTLDNASLRDAPKGGVVIPSPSSTPILSLSHVLGYLGKISDTELSSLSSNGYTPNDSLGKTGLEKMYEPYLRGQYGRKTIEVNAAGKSLSTLTVEPPRPGKNINLSLDLEAQAKLEQLIIAASKTTGKKRFAAVALNPQNGEILALVSYPAFDNNQFYGGISQDNYNALLNNPDRPLFNRAVGGGYPPGSTIKPLMAAAALQEKVITINTTVLSTGGLMVGDRFFKDWLAGGHGVTNVIKALAQSVNTFFYYIGGGYQNFIGLGVDRIDKYLTSFHLGEQTGIDLPGETAGSIPTKATKLAQTHEPWYVGDTYNLSIGEGNLLVSPVQVAMWTAAVANGGTIITPHLVTKIVDPLTNAVITPAFPAVKNTAVGADALAIVQEGMRACVTVGSCRPFGALPFAVAAKTGTAQWSATHDTHAWITAYAPFNNPQIAITVLVEEGGEGSTAATPIAKGFLEWWGSKYLK